MMPAVERTRVPQAPPGQPGLIPSVTTADAFKGIVQSLPDAILIHHDSRVVFVNPSCMRLLGATLPEQLIGTHISQTIHPDSWPAIQSRIEETFRRGTASIPMENVMVALDGSFLDVEVIAIPITWNGSPAIEIVARDIKQRKLAEQAVHEWQKRLELAQKAGLRIGLWEWNYVADTIVWPEETCRLFGYEPSEFGGKRADFLGRIHPQDRQRIEQAGLKVINGGQDYEVQYRFVKCDGTTLWIDSLGVVVPNCVARMIGVAIDITEMKKSQESLRESEEKYLLLLNSTAEGIYGLDLDGVCTFCNRSAALALGYQHPDELLGKTVHKMHHHTHRDGTPYSESECRIHRGYLRAEGTHEQDEVYFRVDGTAFPVEYWSFPIRRGDDIVGSVVTFMDITERRKLEQQFMQSQKMEAIGALAGGIAHDFNNALSVINGYSELLQLKLAPDDPLHRQAEQILQAGQRAAGLTRQLLAFSRKQSLRPVVLDLSTVVTETDKMLRRLIGENIELIAVSDPELGRVKADPGQIGQVLMNLAVNARDAMPSGGKLIIETFNARIEKGGPHRYAKAGDYVVLRATDTGCGMDKQTQVRIFEPFYTTKDTGKGTGLGLSTVYGIVKHSDGYVWAESEPGKGASFSVYLPRVDAAAETLLVPKAVKALPCGCETILLVEDEPALRGLARACLEQGGYSVVEASDAESALRIAKECNGAIGLLLTDVILPDVSGRDLADRLRELWPETKVLYMSGYTDDLISHHGVLSPETMLLEKPFSIESLMGKVREALDSRVAKSATASAS